MLASPNMPLFTRSRPENKGGSQESAISDKCIYSEPGGVVPGGAGVQVHNMPGLLVSYPTQTDFPHSVVPAFAFQLLAHQEAHHSRPNILPLEHFCALYIFENAKHTALRLNCNVHLHWQCCDTMGDLVK